jgi:hypothetical protein
LQEAAITLHRDVDEMPLYFNMPARYTIDGVGTKSVVIKSSGNEKMQVTVLKRYV